jgi:CheY-like chemotaxis protein/tetratricopeptide (TPR) repeat protein
MPSVLICDDDKHTRALLRTIFEQDERFAKHGLTVHEAADGVAGLMAFDQHRAEIVIVDLLMPRMDGFKLCQAIREREHGKTAGLVVVSGAYRDADSAKKVQESYGALWFQKPYQLSDLATAVGRLLEGSRKSEVMMAPPEDVPAAGTLGDAGLPRLLIDLFERRATGMLELRRAKLEKRIDLVAGHPVSVSSNQRSEALGALLVGRGMISEEQHAQALRRAHDEGERLGESLVELGMLTAAQLVKALTAQARAMINSALRWEDGAWTYAPNRDLLDRNKGNALDPIMVVLVGLKQTGSLDLAMRALDAASGRPLRLTARGERYRDRIERAFGDKLLPALARPASVATVLEAWPDAAAAMQALEALLLTGCAEVAAGATSTAGAPPTATAGATPGAPARPQTLIGAVPLPPSFVALPGAAASGRGLAPGLGRPPLPAPPSPAAASSAGAAPSAAAASSPRSSAAPVSGSPRPGTAQVAVAPSAAPSASPSPSAAAKARDPVSLVDLVAGESPGARSARSGPPAPVNPKRGLELWDDLFGENEEAGAPTPSTAVGPAPATPEAVPEAIRDEVSGIIEMTIEVSEQRLPDEAATAEARETLLAEYLRVQALDAYGVLGLEPGATADHVDAAFGRLALEFSLERFSAYNLGPDHGKLEEIHAAHRRAYEILATPAMRADLDARITGPAQPSPAIAGELAFSEGEKLLEQGDVDGAVAAFRRALGAVPDAADYHAALGFALHRKALAAPPGVRGELERAVTIELELALAIDPDHAPGHEYLGRVLAERGQAPDEALGHLERALSAQPIRFGALPAYAALLAGRGDHQALERRYRVLIHTLGDSEPGRSLELWLSLAALYRDRLADPSSARMAFGAAARLAPDDPAIAHALEALTRDRPELWPEHLDALRRLVRLEPEDPGPVKAVATGAVSASAWDLAYLAAGLLSLRDPDDAAGAEPYRRFRPRFLVRAQAPLALAERPGLRHRDDDPAFEALFAQLGPLLDCLAPVDLRGIGAEAPLGPSELPPLVARVRAYLARLLEVAEPALAPSAVFADQAHAAAPAGGPPLILAGPGLLSATDAVPLTFQLTRAMTYLWPGRAAAGARPGRLLRSVVRGLASLGGRGVAQVALDPGDTVAAQARDWLAAASDDTRDQVRHALARLMLGRTNLNLSAWLRAMARTADRVALLVCGDPVVAVRAADAIGGADEARELAAFAISAPHLAARAGLGLSIDV